MSPSESDRSVDKMPIDVVYLWVNGSDSEFLAKLQHYKELYNQEEDVGSSRFKDNGELFYSLRALHMHAPWVRNIYILSSDGQVPSWLDVTNPRIKIIPDSTIFKNSSHTPTFSSPAIEINMYNIPGLSDNFLHFNDDWYLGKDVTPEDFLSSEGSYKIRVAWPSPVTCRPTDDNYAKTMCHVNKMYDSLYGAQSRNVISHAPHLINRQIVEDLRHR